LGTNCRILRFHSSPRDLTKKAALRSVPLSGQDRTGPRPQCWTPRRAQSVKGPRRSGRLQYYLAPGQSSRGRTINKLFARASLCFCAFLAGRFSHPSGAWLFTIPHEPNRFAVSASSAIKWCHAGNNTRGRGPCSAPPTEVEENKFDDPSSLPSNEFQQFCGSADCIAGSRRRRCDAAPHVQRPHRRQ
jgi:hypothetical protein